MPDVFGLGQCSLDYIGRIPAWPSPDTKCEFRDMIIQGGGPVATALVALSRWGLACHFTGVVGDDPFGHEISRFLQEEGVDTSGLVERPGHQSQLAFIASEPGGHSFHGGTPGQGVRVGVCEGLPSPGGTHRMSALIDAPEEFL